MMRGTAESPRTDGWVSASATVIACKQKWGIHQAADNSVLPEYIATFTYTVNGLAYKGKYRANSIRVLGQTFEILYDPKSPEKNTGSDLPLKPWIRWTARILGIGTAIGMIWFWGD